MHAKGISAAEMALRTGIAVENLLKLETAEWCRLDDIRTLCRALGFEEPRLCAKERFGE